MEPLDQTLREQYLRDENQQLRSALAWALDALQAEWEGRGLSPVAQSARDLL